VIASVSFQYEEKIKNKSSQDDARKRQMGSQGGKRHTLIEKLNI